MHYGIVDTLITSLSFPFFPEVLSVVPLLQACSTYENKLPLSFWNWLTSLNMMPSNCTHLSSNHMVSFFLVDENNSIIYMDKNNSTNTWIRITPLYYIFFHYIYVYLYTYAYICIFIYMYTYTYTIFIHLPDPFKCYRAPRLFP
jgi:hypothetical protein